MDRGARTPEELETLLEDAFLLRDRPALADLFEARAVLAAGGGLPEAHGPEAIGRAAARLWTAGRGYLADPRQVLQVGDTALVVSARAAGVARRAADGSWRYLMVSLDPG